MLPTKAVAATATTTQQRTITMSLPTHTIQDATRPDNKTWYACTST